MEDGRMNTQNFTSTINVYFLGNNAMIMVDPENSRHKSTDKILKQANDQHMTTSFHTLLKDKGNFKEMRAKKIQGKSHCDSI